MELTNTIPLEADKSIPVEENEFIPKEAKDDIATEPVETIPVDFDICNDFPEDERPQFKWDWNKMDLIMNTESRKNGISYREELNLRQLGCNVIQQMVTAQCHGSKEHLIICVASAFFHRYFKFHSFVRFKYIDIAAACYFLAAKSESCPRELKYIVTHWKALSTPHNPKFVNEDHYYTARDFIVQLEAAVLGTLAFDLEMDLPQPYVVQLLEKHGKGDITTLQKMSYFLVPDVMVVTDWIIRYKSPAIATACVNIAAFFLDINIKDVFPSETADKWFNILESTMTHEELNEMRSEFLDIFINRPDLHTKHLRKVNFKGKVQVRALPPNASVFPILPPPPTAPVLEKSDVATDKGRQQSNLPVHTSCSVAEQKLENVPEPSFVLPPPPTAPVLAMNELDITTHKERQQNSLPVQTTFTAAEQKLENVPELSFVLPPPPPAPVLAMNELNITTHKGDQQINFSVDGAAVNQKRVPVPGVQNAAGTKEELEKDYYRHYSHQELRLPSSFEQAQSVAHGNATQNYQDCSQQQGCDGSSSSFLSSAQRSDALFPLANQHDHQQHQLTILSNHQDNIRKNIASHATNGNDESGSVAILNENMPASALHDGMSTGNKAQAQNPERNAHVSNTNST